MSRVITTTEIFTTKHGETCNIELEILKFEHEKAKPKKNIERYRIEYIYRAVKLENGEYVEKQVLENGFEYYDVEYINNLFAVINQSILSTDVFTDSLNDLESKASLIYAKEKLYYGTLATDWEIV